jgi:hypothetical protein
MTGLECEYIWYIEKNLGYCENHPDLIAEYTISVQNICKMMRTIIEGKNNIVNIGTNILDISTTLQRLSFTH